MACGPCSGTPAGYVKVWHHVLNGKTQSEHAEQHEALAAQRAAGGAGRVQQVVKRATK